MTALLDETISALEAIDPAALSDGQLHRLVLELQAADSRLALVRAQVLSVWDARKLWADDGSKAGWGRLTRECHLTEGHAKAEMGRARQLRTMPATVVAVHEGKLSIDQADLLRTANRPELAERFAQDETMLIADIVNLRLDDARRAVDYWIDAAYDELGNDRPYRSRDGRHLKAVRTFGGTVDVRGRLDPLAAPKSSPNSTASNDGSSKTTGPPLAPNTAPTPSPNTCRVPHSNGWPTPCRSWPANQPRIARACTASPAR
jgi:hypothetical protein